MQIRVTKTIISRSGKHGKLVGILIIIFILPVAVLLLAPILLFTLIAAFVNVFKRKSRIVTAHDPNINLLLVSNERVSIALIEDETDEEYKIVNALWGEKVFDKMTTIYRASTTPEIPGLHRQYITNFVKETGTGVFLQLIEHNRYRDEHIGSRLIFLRFSDLSITAVSDVGNYQLMQDKRNPWLLKGFNRYEQMELSITYRDH